MCEEFDKWRAIRVAWLAWGDVLVCWRGLRACVGSMLVWVTWVTCLCGWRASVGDLSGVLAWVVC